MLPHQRQVHPHGRRRIARVKRDISAVGIAELGSAGFDTLIDARSPSEYAEDHIPGAISAPGAGRRRARRASARSTSRSPPSRRRSSARALVARNIARHVETLFAGKDAVLAAARLLLARRQALGRRWRTSCARSAGTPRRSTAATRPTGARWWPSSRRCRRASRSAWSTARRAAARAGCSQALRAAGAQVLDLEALAAHRGSVLGELPGRPQPTQKGFESLLLRALRGVSTRRVPVFVEGESQEDRPAAGARGADRAHARLALRRARGRRRRARGAAARGIPPFRRRPRRARGAARLPRGLHGAGAHRGMEVARARRAPGASSSRALLVEHYDPAYRRSAPRNFRAPWPRRSGWASILRTTRRLPRPPRSFCSSNRP